MREGQDARATWWLLFGAACALQSITLSQSLMGLAVAVWVAHAVVRRRSWPAPEILPLALWVSLIVWGTLSALLSPEPARALDASASTLKWLVAPLAAAVLTRRREDLLRAVLLLQAAFLGAWALAEFALFWNGDPLLRVRGPFSHHMTLSGVLLLCTLQSLPRPDLSVLGVPRGRLAGGLCAALGAAGLVSTLTRSAVLAAAVALLLLGLHRPGRIRPGRLAVLLLLTLIPLAAMTLHLWGGWISPDLPSASSASARDRVELWKVGGAMVKDHPLLGIGANRVRREAGNYLPPGYRRPAPPSHLHSAPLTLAAERGIPALLLALALHAIAAIRAYRIGGGLLAALCGFLVMGLFEDNFDDAEVVFIHLMILGAIFRPRRDPAVP